jgi:3-dehydroquinate synthase
MHASHEIDQSFEVPFAFPVLFTRGAFASDNPVMPRVLAPDPYGVPRKVLVLVDDGVAHAWPGLMRTIPERIDETDGIAFAGEITLIPGGERAKNGLAVVEQVARLAARHSVDRQSYVLAIGGGAVLDAVGLGAALVHRGARFVRMPSTVLAQNDAGIGVKNGVNAYGQKNFLGCFAPPHAVVNDLDLLDTLSLRQWRSGIAEAVKVACIKDAGFLTFLEEQAAALARRARAPMETLVRTCARLHMEHTRTCGDPFETGNARPLDFGHWSAHWLEMASGGTVTHGEGVAIGLAIDVLYARRQGLVAAADVDRVLACLEGAGFALWHDLLEDKDAHGRAGVFAGLDRFREHLGGRLTLTLPGPLGQRHEIHAVDLACMSEAIDALRKRAR